MTAYKRLIQLNHIKSQLSDRTEAQRAEIARIDREIAKLNKIVKGREK